MIMGTKEENRINALKEQLKQIAAYQQQSTWTDIEADHCNADDILCEILTELGYEEIVEMFESIEKWYG
jgi:hypothetical protein